ncbi:MAG: beta-galactosidase trimerization domain-containing protein, partial [bacterium]|nr:beta-galactosidase trimerization domain-containing protein [bacterium]
MSSVISRFMPAVALCCVLLAGNPATGEPAADGLTLDIKEVQPLDKSGFYRTSEYPDVLKVDIKGNRFVQNGKPRFLLGIANSITTDTALQKILGLDITETQPSGIYSNRAKKTGDTVEASFDDIDWYGEQLKRLGQAGILAWVEHKAHVRNDPTAALYPEVATTSHFIAWCPENPLGKSMYRNFWTNHIRQAGRYPVFAYELWNEAAYTCDCVWNLEKFRSRMKEKYGTIERANRYWSTGFRNFDDITVPHKTGNAMNNITPNGFPRELMTDWMKFTEERFAELIVEYTALHRQLDERPVSRVVQTHANLQYAYGLIGVNPHVIAPYLSFYAHEGYHKFVTQEAGHEKQEQLTDMLSLSLADDVVRSACPDKPVINSEGGAMAVSGGGDDGSILAQGVVNLHRKWRFKLEKTEQGLTDKYWAPEYDDSRWGLMDVPCLWEDRGTGSMERDVTEYGWYRTEFKVSPALKDKKFYLIGRGLDDSGRIWINGNKVFDGGGFDKIYCTDLTPYLRLNGENILAIEIIDPYLYGGIRNWITISNRSLDELNGPAPLTPGQMRSYLWSRVAHGMNGQIFFQFSSDEVGGTSFWNQRFVSREALKMIPVVKQEINSLGDIALRKSPKAKLGFIYSYETLRGAIPKNYDELIKGPVSSDLLKYYAGAVFSGNSPDVLTNRQILDGAAAGYPVIMMPMCERVHPDLPRKLEAYVRNGGVLVIGPGGMSMNDEYAAEMPTPAWLGIEVGPKVSNTGDVTFRKYGFKSAVTMIRNLDGSSGRRITVADASVIAAYNDGTPAVTCKQLGKGKVYYIGCELGVNPLTDLFKAITAENGIEPSLQAVPDGSRAYIETKIMGASGRYVLFALNWGGGDRRVSLRPLEVEKGEYIIRDVASGKVITGGSGKVWNDKALSEGIPVVLPSQEAMLYVMERKGLAQTPIERLGKTQRETLAGLWLDKKEKKGD